MKATNRQKKLLRFFRVKFSPYISSGAAGWEISHIMSNEENQKLWNSYLYVTKDFDNQSDELVTVDEDLLTNTIIPEDWDPGPTMADYKLQIASDEINSFGPFDIPEPEIIHRDNSFVFTGKFEFGSRNECEQAVSALGGKIGNKVSAKVDYLVIGKLGNNQWKNGTFGNKIEKAIFIRREHGNPAIVSESHWKNSLPE